MKRIHVPVVHARYWLAITLASLFGTNLGDFYAHESGLSLQAGLGVLAALLILVFALERRDQRPHELYYWSAILIIRTGATNIADFLSFRAGIPRVALGIGVVAVLAFLTWTMTRAGWKKADRRTDRLPTPDSSSAGLPATNVLYWAAMLTAGVLGTVLGDDASHAVGEGAASIGLGLLLVLVLMFTRGGLASVAAYWGTVAVARTAGTTMGDWLAENHTLNLGLSLSTLLTGTAFVLVLVLWRARSGRSSLSTIAGEGSG